MRAARIFRIYWFFFTFFNRSGFWVSFWIGLTGSIGDISERA